LGCSRYDDGPAISFRTAKNRVLGTWQVEKLLINDLDSTELYRDQIGCELEFTNELFYEDGERYVIYYKDCIDDTIRKGVWYFYNNLNNELMVGFSSDIYSNPIGPIGRWGSWDILRLTNDEMHLLIKPSKDYWGHPKETTYYLELNKLQYETLFNNNHVNNCNSFSFYI
jgi:hypothetical protein